MEKILKRHFSVFRGLGEEREQSKFSTFKNP